MQDVKNMKAVIIAAGYGTRFLPCSKTIPKEMFPLIDTPAIDLIIDELAASGIKDILIVTSRRKKVLEDYFDREIELETFFKSKNDNAKLAQILPENLNIFFVRQKEMQGTGHALLICKEFIGNDSFIVAYPDDIVFSSIPLSKQLIDIHNNTGESVLAVQEIEGDVSRYGVIDYEKAGDTLKVNKIIEKPAKGIEPSKMISVGRYLFTSELLTLLEDEFKSHKDGEFYHIGAINKLAAKNKMFACKYSGERMDIGDKCGYIDAIIKYGLERQDLKNQVKDIILKYSKSN